jgi:allantoin racemase
MRIANLVSSGEFWKRISRRLEDESARTGGASADHYYVETTGLRGTSLLSLNMTDRVFISAGIRAAEAGCDAIFVNAVPDYGVPLLRASVQVPVIGAGEACMYTARSLGQRFSIVTFWPESYRPMYDRLLSQSGMGEYCASVTYALPEGDPLADRNDIKPALEARDKSLVDQLERSCRRALDVDGADAVILGCTCMHPVAEELARRVDGPVLDPAIVGWNFAQLVLKSTANGRIRGMGAPLEHRRAFLALDTEAGEKPVSAECEVCEVVAAVPA